MFRVSVREEDAIAYGQKVDEFSQRVGIKMNDIMTNHTDAHVELENIVWWGGYQSMVVAQSEAVRDLGVFLEYIHMCDMADMWPSDFKASMETYFTEVARLQEMDHALGENAETQTTGHEPERTW